MAKELDLGMFSHFSHPSSFDCLFEIWGCSLTTNWTKFRKHRLSLHEETEYFLRRLASFNICRKLLQMFYLTVVCKGGFPPNKLHPTGFLQLQTAYKWLVCCRLLAKLGIKSLPTSSGFTERISTVARSALHKRLCYWLPIKLVVADCFSLGLFLKCSCLFGLAFNILLEDS